MSTPEPLTNLPARFAERVVVLWGQSRPHLWAVTLHDEVRELGYRGGYSTFTRALRTLRLRPHCEACAASKGRDHALIEHPPGEETQ